MSDPMGFFVDDFVGIETSEGLSGGDMVPEQMALLKLEEVSYALSKTKGTPEVTCRVRCDEKYALTPKRGFFHRFHLTDAMQRQVDGFTRAAGIGRGRKRFGDPTGDKDIREKYSPEEFDEAAKALAVALTGRTLVGHVGIEPGTKGYSDKNKIFSYYQASERNLEAIVAAGYEPKKVKVVKEKLASGVEQRFLALKTSAGMVPSRSGVIE